MRKFPLVALLLGVALLSVGLVVLAGSLYEQRQKDEALRYDASQVATAFSAYFERARSIDLLLAQSPAIRQAGNGRAEYLAANRALAYLEHLYPGAIGEACLIDDRGHELARVTDGTPAAVADLSNDESRAPFFAPTLALQPGTVFQAAPYVSPDTKTWVISNSTLTSRPDGRRLIVHFEVSLGSFAPSLRAGSSDQHSAVLNRRDGRTMLTDVADVTGAATREDFPLSPYRAVLGSRTAQARTDTVDGQRLATSAIAGRAENANDWVVVQWSTHRATLSPAWIGGAATAAGVSLILLFVLLMRRQTSALRMASRLDHLTGMANRKAFEEALDQAVSGAADGAERIAVLMLDLDGFKQINDTLGHDSGDLVLKEIGRRLHANTFEYDTAARLGGDEFAVVLRRLHETMDVATVAERLREALIRPIEIEGAARFVGVSIGAAVCPDHGTSSADLLRASDAAMYRAKRGREGVRVYEAGTALGASESWLAAELLVAIENEEITLVYQPEYALDTGRVVGVEALARWPRHEGPDIPPSQFVVLAEETGLIRQLTHLTLRIALDEALSWRALGACVPVSVNLSARLVTDRSLPATVEVLLAERGLSGDSLILEITETAVIDDMQAACETLRALRLMGVRIELDDFGSGYASMKALHEMPMDGLKLDRDLVNGTSPSAQRLLAAAIDMGTVLHLYIVAEGIEDAPRLHTVRTLGAHIAQGYHLSRPLSSQTIRETLSHHALPVE